MTMSQTKIAKAVKETPRSKFVAFCKAENVAFLDANRKSVYIEYVRDPLPTNADRDSLVADLVERAVYRRGRLTAVLVAYRASNGDVTVGWSARHPGNTKKRPEEFNKAIGLWKAIRRATGQGRKAGRIPDRLLYGFSTDGVTPNTKIDEFLERANAEFANHTE